MLKILMGPNVKILMGQSFGSWTHGHGPMAWAQGLAHGPGPGPMAAPGKVWVGGGGGALNVVKLLLNVVKLLLIIVKLLLNIVK